MDASSREKRPGPAAPSRRFILPESTHFSKPTWPLKGDDEARSARPFRTADSRPVTGRRHLCCEWPTRPARLARRVHRGVVGHVSRFRVICYMKRRSTTTGGSVARPPRSTPPVLRLSSGSHTGGGARGKKATQRGASLRDPWRHRVRGSAQVYVRKKVAFRRHGSTTPGTESPCREGDAPVPAVATGFSGDRIADRDRSLDP